MTTLFAALLCLSINPTTPPQPEPTKHRTTHQIKMNPPTVYDDSSFSLPRLLTQPSKHPEITPPIFRSGDGLITTFYIGDGDRRLAVAAERENGHLLIYIDTDRDNDLSDEKPHHLEINNDESQVTATTSSIDGYPISYLFSQREVLEGMQPMMERVHGRRVTRETTLWGKRLNYRTGEFKINDTVYLIGLKDWEFDGRYDGERDLLLIDRNGDNQVSDQLMSGEATEGTTSIQIGSTAYAVSIDPSGDTIELAPKPGPPIKIKQLAVGDRFPIAQHDTLAGVHTFSIESMQGKWALIDFWGEWCMPCVKQLPDLVALQNELSKEHFAIAGYLVTGSPEHAEQLLQSNKADWPNAILTQENARLNYLVSGYPTKFLLNPEGIIAAVNPTIDQVRKTVADHKP
mgnify:CR=1 FL=1